MFFLIKGSHLLTIFISYILRETFKGLTSIIIPPGVKVIEANSFYQCSSLSSVIIQSSVTSIYSNAFKDCISLSTFIYLGSNPQQCSSSSFYNCTSLNNICVPIDYNSSSFCGKQVYSNLTKFDYLRNQTNHCYNMIVCNSSYGNIIKRPNASEWKSHSNGCFEYESKLIIYL